MMSSKNYHETTNKPNFPKIEEGILDFWNKEKIFKRSVDERDEKDEFVFYDGPPFANGLPHYGHVLQSYAKDTVARYQTMKGKKVNRRWGWDCHGLPPELKTEKELGISGKKAIEEYGVDKFTDKCACDVLTYTNNWKGIVNRLGRWVDMENAYKTMDKEYSESIMWAFKTLYEKGLLYEDFRILPYSWAAETPLSNFEVNQGYKDKTDTTATVKFKLENGLTLLVWTTTPWTLPSNLMLATGADIEYTIFEREGEKLVLATARIGAYKKELDGAVEIGKIKGSELKGIHYTPLFPYFEKYREEYDAFQVLNGDFVSTEDGTGIVHLAPGFGEDDFNLCKNFNANFPILCPVDSTGCFGPEVKDFEGKQVFDANDEILSRLKAENKLFKKDQMVHSYPFCWRTDKPLIYKAMSSWFVRVSDIKDKLIEANQSITWIPEHIKNGRFGKWLEGARDWSISRNRFWGAPIPVWKSDNPEYPRIDVFGSIAEIEKASGMKVENLHRPHIDKIVYPNPDDPTGKSMMRRVSDVFDCWFESGSMPFASCHYPFENKEWFERNFPADFITEATDQTRGWFYTLVVMGVALFGKAPFKTCVCSGFVFDEKGQKLSKKLGNYSEPTEFFNKYGSDAFRWLLLSSPLLRGEIARISKEGVEVATTARKSQIPLYNAYHFFTLYANADEIKAVYDLSSDNIMDKYIIAKLDELKEIASLTLDKYDIATFCSKVEKFLDILNNWYIRQSRERFWGTSVDRATQQEAFNTLYSVLIDLCKIIAPLMPFITEFIYKNLTGEDSVHLVMYPQSSGKFDKALIEAMDMVQDVCSAVKNIREEVGIRNRQPLSSMTIASPKEAILKPYSDIIKSESNVKDIVFTSDIDKYAKKLLYIYTPIVGKRLGRALAEIQKSAKANDYTIENGICKIAGYELQGNEFEIRVEILGDINGKATSDNSAVVILDTNITPELSTEGIIRDFIRAIQEERKSRDYNVSDRIELSYYTSDKSIIDGIKKFESEISSTVLSTKITLEASPLTVKIDNTDLSFDIKKV
ncbi:isoleucine--tRNA ligase [bacterium]|nr:isoleucine--tRNA ligase [bacterium]